MTELVTDYYTLGAGGIDGLERIHEYLEASDLEPELLELVKFRASQINGCGHCLEVHAERLEELGEDRERLYVLSAWDEVSYFSPRERAALAWTEVVTRISRGVPDDCYEAAREEFTDEELVALTFAIGDINIYNRLALCFREAAGDE